MNLIVFVITAFILVFFLATVCFGLYVWWKKKSYTRERFAFAGLSAFSAFLLFVLTSIYSQQPPWLAVIGLIKLPYEAPQTLTIEQGILSLVLVVIFYFLITYFYRHWDGAISIHQYQQEQNAQPQGLLRESLLFLRSIRHPDLLAVHNPDSRFSHSALVGADHNLVWHEQAKDLLELSSKSYEFLEDQWHDQQQCWLGRQKHNQNIVLLFCLQDRPDAKQQQKLLDYGKRFWTAQRPGDLEIIFALKEGELDEIQQFERTTLRLVSEARLLDNLVDYSDYFHHLRKQVEQNKLAESDLTLADMYTVSSYQLGKEGATTADLEAFLQQWLAESSLRQLALLGEYGQGKSTAALMFSYKLMQRFQQGEHRGHIPVLLELRGKSPRTLEAKDLLTIWAEPFGIDPRAMCKLMQAGRLLTIFEGFDEVDLLGDANARIEHFKVLWRLCYPKAKILITGRPNYFLDDAELKCALGINDHSLDNPYCQAVYLAPFTKQEITQSLRKLDAGTRNGIVALAETNPRFYDIVSRPSMLYVVSVLWRKGELENYRGQINSAIVMDLFIHHSYQRQNAKEINHIPLKSHERAFFMEGIAAYMLVKHLPNQISTQQLDEVVRLLIPALPDAVSQPANAIANEPQQLLRERYDLQKANKFAEAVDYIKADVRACGLLVSDLSRSNSFKFGHKSFMEFLAGKVFAQWCLPKDLAKPETASANALVNKLGLTMRAVTSQPEVMDFAAQWIAHKAKDHAQAAKLLFALQFNTHNIFRKIAGQILLQAFRCLPWLLSYRAFVWLSGKSIFL